MKDEDIEKLRHKNRMIEIKVEKEARIEVENLKFNYSMQLQRIKTAEIRKSMDRRANRDFAEKTKY